MSCIETMDIAIKIKKAPKVEKSVIGSFSMIIDSKTATTISDKSKIVEVEAERCLSPSSHK